MTHNKRYLRVIYSKPIYYLCIDLLLQIFIISRNDNTKNYTVHTEGLFTDGET